jgi:hypothetical protein
MRDAGNLRAVCTRQIPIAPLCCVLGQVGGVLVPPTSHRTPWRPGLGGMGECGAFGVLYHSGKSLDYKVS